MNGQRHRLVIEQDGEQTVSGLILTDWEIMEAVEAEARLHEAAGWNVRRYGATLRLAKNDTVRWVWVRSRTAMEDTV